MFAGSQICGVISQNMSRIQVKGAKIQFRCESGANPELSVRIAQTGLRVPELRQQ
jgi:hypothetical protein